MKTYFATLACAAAAQTYMANDDTMRFWKWAIEHERNYQSVEELEFRFANFLRTEAKIEVLNSLGHDAVYGLNNLSDYTKEEYEQMLGTIPTPPSEQMEEYEADDAEDEFYEPDADAVANGMTVDWKSKGAVTGVKYQGNCGACWSFAATGAMEGAHHKATGKLVSLSEQQLIDCDTNAHGCNGGYIGSAFKYASGQKVETESAYPYKKVQGKCRANSGNGLVQVKSYKTVTKKSVSATKKAIQQGPVTADVNASSDVFSNYKSGVICSGCGTSTNHGVLIVGYGTSNGKEFYYVKNSWGTKWGDNGYLRIGITDGEGCCGIQKDVIQVVSTN